MSETTDKQVEDAISRHLHLGGPAKTTSMYGMHWHYPVGIIYGDIEMRDSDCGLVKNSWTITTAEWEERVEKYGLYKSVGLWEFVPADDPAVAEIRSASRCPTAAGRALYDARQEIERLRAELDRRNGKRRDCETCGNRTPFSGAVFCSEACVFRAAEAAKKGGE